MRISCSIAVCFLLLGMGGCRFKEVKKESSATICRYHMHQIGLALRTYKIRNGAFPPPFLADKNGMPLHSWRVLLLPYLEAQHLYDRYDFSKPWNDPQNLEIAEEGGVIYNKCISCDLPIIYTAIVAVVGEGTVWDVKQRIKRDNENQPNSVMLVEALQHKTHWMAPNDLNLKQVTDLETVLIEGVHGSGLHGWYANAVLEDGSTIKIAMRKGTPKLQNPLGKH